MWIGHKVVRTRRILGTGRTAMLRSGRERPFVTTHQIRRLVISGLIYIGILKRKDLGQRSAPQIRVAANPTQRRCQLFLPQPLNRIQPLPPPRMDELVLTLAFSVRDLTVVICPRAARLPTFRLAEPAEESAKDVILEPGIDYSRTGAAKMWTGTERSYRGHRSTAWLGTMSRRGCLRCDVGSF